jgi:putative tryptophan/tyrosine transport system substrate-binding protein
MTIDRLERRAFLTFVGAAGAASAFSHAGFGQRMGTPSIGVLSSGRADQAVMAAFKQGLSEAGLADGIGVTVEFRWADDQYDRLSALAKELAARKVWVIAALGLNSALAAKPAAGRMPLVFVIEGDPIKFGLVSNLSQPGGNATGVSFLASELAGTQFNLLQQLVLNPPAVGLLVNPNNSSTAQDLEAAASAHTNKLVVAKASQASELDAAFASLVQQGARALVIPGDSFFLDQRQKLVALAAQHSLPTMYPAREFVVAGGLMSYGASLAEADRQAGIYAGWIVKGTPVLQLPVQQNVKVEFVINLDTANTFGLTVPVSLLGRADSVIQAR